MKRAIIALTAAAALAGCSGHPSGSNKVAASASRPSDADSDAYMRKAETDWATAPLKERGPLLQRILADDYIAVGTKGAVRNKQQAIAADTAMPANPGESAKLDHVQYRHFGDTVIALGQETGSSSGKMRTLVWTDVWMFRNGKWQVVASQDTVKAE